MVAINLPIKLASATGQADNVFPVWKFGANQSVGTSFETIWSAGGLYNYIASATSVNISSSDTDDTSAGTGARTVLVSGLDANWDLATETVVMDGQTLVATTETFIRMFRIQVITGGSGGANAGDIYVSTGTATNGVPDDSTLIYAKVIIGDNQTLQAVYTVPRGCKGVYGRSRWLMPPNKTTDVRMLVRDAGTTDSVFQTRELYTTTTGTNAFLVDVPRDAVESFSEMTDIELRAKVSAGNAIMSASFDLECVKLGGT